VRTSREGGRLPESWVSVDVFRGMQAAKGAFATVSSRVGGDVEREKASSLPGRHGRGRSARVHGPPVPSSMLPSTSTSRSRRARAGLGGPNADAWFDSASAGQQAFGEGKSSAAAGSYFRSPPLWQAAGLQGATLNSGIATAQQLAGRTNEPNPSSAGLHPAFGGSSPLPKPRGSPTVARTGSFQANTNPLSINIPGLSMSSQAPASRSPSKSSDMARPSRASPHKISPMFPQDVRTSGASDALKVSPVFSVPGQTPVPGALHSGTGASSGASGSRTAPGSSPPDGYPSFALCSVICWTPACRGDRQGHC